MRQIRTLKPGDPYIRAEDINALAGEVKRLGKIEGDGVEIDNGGSGIQISASPSAPAFWAELLDEPAADGWYSWRQVTRTYLGVFEELLYGRTDEGMMSPAREANGLTGLPTLTSTGDVGTYVWLERGRGEPVSGGVLQEWLFRHGGGGGAPPTTFRGALMYGSSTSVPAFGDVKIAWESVAYDTDNFIISSPPQTAFDTSAGLRYRLDAHLVFEWLSPQPTDVNVANVYLGPVSGPTGPVAGMTAHAHGAANYQYVSLSAEWKDYGGFTPSDLSVGIQNQSVRTLAMYPFGAAALRFQMRVIG